MDAQDAQDKQDERPPHGKQTRSMIECGFADVQDCKPAVFRKILCILCIDVNQKSTRA